MDDRGNTAGSPVSPGDGTQRAPESSPAVRTYGIADPDATDDKEEEQYENF
jgi:hypothetical protein